ncbi:MAG: hypothetical protein AB201_03530 [Parcubacteria bacterium C7867-006]|nr:MAG: hypothetical protein AB201_03530 [Parcubacteria bacterium C7867-006]
MKKNLLISLVIILLSVAIGLSIKFNLHTKLYNYFNKPVRQELPDVPGAKSYSINGVVNSVSGNTLKITVSRLFAGPNGNYIASEDKTVKIIDTTEIQFTYIENAKFVKIPATLSDIKPGITIVLYSDKNIARMDSFTPDKIDIPKK